MRHILQKEWNSKCIDRDEHTEINTENDLQKNQKMEMGFASHCLGDPVNSKKTGMKWFEERIIYKTTTSLTTPEYV